jgi:hypothetical protein
VADAGGAIDDRAQRDQLERLQVEARALDERLAEVRPKIRPARKAADAAEDRHQLMLSELWKLRTDNARLEVQTGSITPDDDSPAAPLFGLALIVGGLIAILVAILIALAGR